MMDRPPGPMHEIIRRTQEEVRVYSNNYGAIKIISAALHQADAVDKGASSSRLSLNNVQRFHLLLLRADAYSATRQHERALDDATAALRLCRGRLAEAHFTAGRELLRLHRAAESVAAFERGEAQLSGLGSSGSGLGSGLGSGAMATIAAFEDTADDDFWAQRGLELSEVARLRLSRRDVELEEQTCGAPRTTPTSLEPPAASQELSLWRRIAREARALLSMRTSHVIPLALLPSTIAMLEHSIAHVRGGLVVCVENTTCWTFRLVGHTSPSSTYHAEMHFPECIAPGHCGLALVQAAGWGGFVGSVCYELDEGGTCCDMCYEVSFMGSARCGVRFVPERRICNGKADPARELRIPNPNLWLPTQSAAMPSGRRLKVSSGTRASCGNSTSANTSTGGTGGGGIVVGVGGGGGGGGRTIVFSVAEVLSVRLRSIELLRALEFAGPLVLKKLSAVSRRYRELVNNLPPYMFFGAGRRSYPDYCILGDRISSPWIVRDKEPVTWLLIFDSRSGNRENFIIVDSTDPQNVILLLSADAAGFLEASVYYGDRRSPIAQIKGSWVPFSSTLYMCSASGRTFASCALNQQSNLTLSWEGINSKSKLSDVEFIMLPKDITGRRVEGVSKPMVASALAGSVAYSSESVGPASYFTMDESVTSHDGTRSAAPVRRRPLGGSFAVWRPMQTSGASLRRNALNQSNGGMELVAEVSLNVLRPCNPMKGTTLGEMKIFPGTDALMLSLLVYCKSHWGS